MSEKKTLGSLELNRIYQMDCLEGMRLLPDDSVDLVFTSPPYADQRNYGHADGTIKPDDYVQWFIPKANEIYRVLKDDGIFILNINNKTVKGEEHLYVYDLLLTLKREIGFKFYRDVIWDKCSTPPRKPITRIYEHCFWFYKKKQKIEAIYREYTEAGKKRYKYAFKKDTYTSKEKIKMLNPKGAISGDIIRINKEAKGNGHPAPFSEGLAEFFVSNFSKKNDIVLDPFMGSGTTAVVSAKLSRYYLGFELNPEYVRIANQRLEAE